MSKAGVVDYESFARKVLGEITDLPISFEVFSDELDEMVDCHRLRRRPRSAPQGPGGDPVRVRRAISPMATVRKRAVFLDRDGVLNAALVHDNKAHAPLALESFRLVPDAAKQVERLRAAGLLCIVVTNQPEVARGRLTQEMLEAMHRRLRETIVLDDVLVCPHDPTEGCECHKPKAGMLHTAAARWGIELTASFVVGDRWRDIGAGQAAGCYTVLIQRPYSQCSTADACVEDLGQAVEVVLQHIGGQA